MDTRGNEEGTKLLALSKILPFKLHSCALALLDLKKEAVLWILGDEEKSRHSITCHFER